MADLYIIGGLSRTGKSTISRRILEHKSAACISTDAIRASLRNAIIGQSYINSVKLHFEGLAEFKVPGSKFNKKKSFNYSISEENEEHLVLKGALGLIDHYDRNNQDLIIEGISFKPKDVSNMKLSNSNKRAVFLGYSNKSHIINIINSAKLDEYDWVNKYMKTVKNYEEDLYKWVDEGVKKSNYLKQQAAKYGYSYFDITEYSFDEYINLVLKTVL